MHSAPTPSPRQHVTIHVSTSTIIKMLGIIALAGVAWFIRDIIGMLFVALVLAAAFDPTVDLLERYHIPRPVTMLAMYIGFFCTFVIVIYLIIPPIIAQAIALSSHLSAYQAQLDSLYQWITRNDQASLLNELQHNLTQLNSSVGNLTSGLFSTLAGIAGTIAQVVFVFVITFYMTIQEGSLKKFIRSVAPLAYQPYLVQKVNRIQQKMGSWLRGQFILMLIIGVLVFIGLSILGVPYALLLGTIAGLAEFIPYFGPILSALPAVFFAYTESPWQAVAVIIMFVVIQQSENQIIVPQIMKKAVGLNPIVSITAMLVGVKVAGVFGILLAVPAATILWIFVEDFFQQKKAAENSLEEQEVAKTL